MIHPANLSVNSSNLAIYWTNHSSVSAIHAFSEPNWGFMPVFRICVAVTAFIANGFILTVFFTQRHLLSSPFNCYLINLLICNALFAGLQNPSDIIGNIYPNTWFLGSVYCTICIYFSWTLGAGMRICHSLITLNRLWAVLWPNSYRIHHSYKTALITILCGWIFMHVTLLPGIITDARFYRKNLTNHSCKINLDAQLPWAISAQFIVYNLQFLIMALAFPVIYWKRRLRSKINTTTGTPSTNTVKPVRTKCRGRNLLGLSFSGSDAVEQADQIRSGGSVNANRETRVFTERSTRAYRVLTLLTVSVTICWTPLMVYYTMLVVAPGRFNMPGLLWSILYVLLSMQSVLDPLLFVAALPDLRRAVWRVVRRDW